MFSSTPIRKFKGFMFSFQEPSSKPLLCQKCSPGILACEYPSYPVILWHEHYPAPILKQIELGKIGALDHLSSLSPERCEDIWGHSDLKTKLDNTDTMPPQPEFCKDLEISPLSLQAIDVSWGLLLYC